MNMEPLTLEEARVLGTLMEKARTVPDSYPMTLNSLVAGCNQKSSRDPITNLSEAEAQDALDGLKRRSLAFATSGNRVMRWEHNFQRAMVVPEQSAVLLGLLMLRGPQTAGELRIHSERWYRFADISSVEGFLEELRDRSEARAVRWSSCCRAPPGPARRAGRTSCAGRWMSARRPSPRPAPPSKGAWPRASRHSNPKWPNCVPWSPTWRRNSVCHHLDSPKRTTVLELPPPSSPRRRGPSALGTPHERGSPGFPPARE